MSLRWPVCALCLVLKYNRIGRGKKGPLAKTGEKLRFQGSDFRLERRGIPNERFGFGLWKPAAKPIT